MLNESGKAKQYTDEHGANVAIKYHEDDRPAAVEQFRRIAQDAGSMAGLLFITNHTTGLTEIYIHHHATNPSAQYVTKIAASILDRKCYDAGKKNGIVSVYPREDYKALMQAAFGSDTGPFSYQDIGL